MLLFPCLLWGGEKPAVLPLELPDAEQITAIEITIIDGFSCSCPDREWIEQFVSVISSAQTTDKPAVQEDPDSDYDGEFSILDGDRITGTIYYYLKDNRGYMKLIWKD